jgi:uncharacterized repeat protein (TIGR01451 family)
VLQAAGQTPITGAGQDVVTTRVSGGSTTLALAKRADHRTVDSGDLIRYRLVVRNRGRVAALGLRVCDRIPRGESFVAAPGVRLVGGRACWTIKRIGVGERRVLTITVRAQRTLNARRVRNVATARGRNAERVTASADVRIHPTEVRPGGVTG